MCPAQGARGPLFERCLRVVSCWCNLPFDGPTCPPAHRPTWGRIQQLTEPHTHQHTCNAIKLHSSQIAGKTKKRKRSSGRWGTRQAQDESALAYATIIITACGRSAAFVMPGVVFCKPSTIYIPLEGRGHWALGCGLLAVGCWLWARALGDGGRRINIEKRQRLLLGCW